MTCKLRTVLFVLLSGVVVLTAAPCLSQVQTLGGDEVEGALKIECGNSGMRVYAYLDGTWKQQTFSDNKSSMVHYDQGGTFKYTAGYYSGTAMTCTKNQNTSATVNERVWTGGSVKLTMRTTYVSPSRAESYEFEIQNTSGSALSNVKFFHGQDTYLGYSDAGGGYWDSGKGVVGVKKPAQDDPGRLIYQTLGSASTTPNDYASANYGVVAGLVAQGSLNQTLDANYTTDNGYAVQWNLGTLSPGQSITINAAETMAVGASLSATVPNAEIGTAVTITGVVENIGNITASGTLSVDVDLDGWTAAINGSSSFSLSQGQSQDVPLLITCPAVVSVGQVATVTLTATAADETAAGAGTVTAVYYDGVALVTNVTDDGAASVAEQTDFGGRPLSTVVTNTYTLYNGGPSNITLLTNALVGSSRFSVAGIPTSLAAGASTNFTVTFDVSSYDVETATLTLFDHKAWSPFVMNLSGFGFTISTNNGPSGYIRTLTVTCGKLGNGEDISQVTIGGQNATIESQTTNSVTFAAPGMSPGWKDIVITSVSKGQQTIVDGYLVNGRGRINSVSPNVAQGAGVDITIDGVNLCNGDVSDLESVTLCGIDATDWVVNGTTQLVVKSGAGGDGKGHVYVTSTSRGIATLYSGFTYGGAKISMATTNGTVIADDAEASPSKQTDFGYVATGRSGIRTFKITNGGPAVLNISMVTTNGDGAEYFELVSCSTQVAAYSEGQLQVAFSSDVPVAAEAQLLFYNNSSNSPFRLNLLAEAITVTPMEGPEAGGTTVTLSNMTFGSLGEVTSVKMVNSVWSGPVVAQGTNWLQFVTPDVYEQTGWRDGTVVSASGSRSLLNSFYFNPAGSVSTISPSSCIWTGGRQVVISGANLCSGLDDITGVTLAGVEVASIVSASPTQVVVIAAPGFGGSYYSYVHSENYGSTYGWNKFSYYGLDSSPYSFSTNAGTASGGQEVTFTFADMGSPVVVTQVMVNKNLAQVTGYSSNSVTFLTPPADWEWMGITNLTLYSTQHGNGSFTCGYWTNIGYRYRGHAFIGQPDIQNGVWQGGWTNLGFGMETSREDIYDLAFGPDGRLYAAGEMDLSFYYDSQVAYFENGRWQETGIKATYVEDMISVGNELYVSGLFLTNHFGQVGNRAPILRGSYKNWTPLSYTSQTANTEPWCYALHHDGTYLYASDYSYSYPGEPDVFRYNESAWTALPDTSFTGKVYALGTYNGRLYRSGDRNSWQDLVPVQYWNGSSWPDDGNIDTGIYGSYPPRALAFCEFKGKYYMGQAAGNPYNDESYKAQLLSRNGTGWSPGWQFVSGFEGMENMLRKDNTGTRALCSDGKYLFAGGVQMWYTPAPPGSNYSCVAAFDGTSWSAIGTQGLTTNYNEWGQNAFHINSLLKTPRGIYAGGWFNRIGTDTNNMSGCTNVAFFLFDQTNGLSVQSGSYAGGTQLTIYGGNLGNGTTQDIYRVTLCGVDATINSVSSTQIVVTTQQGIPGLGDVVVYTYDYGTIVQSNVFTYTGGAGLHLYGTNDAEIANESAASSAFGTRSMAVAGQRLTNVFRVVNSGSTSLSITGVQTNGAGADAFACSWPSSVAAGQTGTVTVVFQPLVSGSFTAAVDVVNSSLGLNSPYTLFLECTAATLSTNNGPYVGGNSLTISDANFGTITNVLIDGTSVAYTESPAGVLNLTLPSATTNGPVDIVLQTSDNGDVTLSDAYTYNPAGWINRTEEGTYVIGNGSSYSSTGHGPLGIAYRSRHYQYIYTSNELANAGLEGPATITAVGYNVYQSPAYPLQKFIVRMRNTTLNTLSNGWISTGLQTCYSNESYAPVAGGFDPLEFSTGFEWDGQQNVVFDTAFASVYNTSSSGRTRSDYHVGDYRERHVYSSSDQTDVFTGGTLSYDIAQIYVEATYGTHGVVPAVGLSTGGYEVAISGRDLCAGDVTNVTLCGVEAAEIISANATQVVVRAGEAPGQMLGDVTVYSTSHGVSTLEDAFRYAGTYSVLGTDGSVIEGGSAASSDNGTLFGSTGGGAALTNEFTITNNIDSSISISSMSFTGAQAASFSVLPTNLVVDAHSVTSFAVVYNPQAGGNLEAQLYMESDSGNASVNMGGSAWSLSQNVGAEEGGITVTITNGRQMGFGDITEVIVGGTPVTPITQGENWVTITMPAHSAGPVDIVIISTILGETTLANAFNYIPAPVIYGSEFTWEELPGLPQALYMHTAFELNDQLYVAGGMDASYQDVTNVYRFDGYRWHDAPGLPAARSAGAGAVLNGAFYYIGGAFTNTAVTNVYSFNGTNWTQVAGLPGAVTKGIVDVVGGDIVVAGGQDASAAYRTNTYLFDGASWTQTAGLPAARSEQGGAVRNSKLYAFGGRNSSSAATFNQYSFSGSDWANEPGLPVTLFGAGAATLNHRVYALGGSDGSAVKDAVYRYDGIGWHSAGVMPTNLYAAAATFWRGAMYVAGGMDSTIPLHTNLWRLTDGGVSPISGYPAGGYSVTIRGTNLCDGTSNDVEWVTLCDATAEVTSVSATQIVVTAGSGEPGSGNVEIQSTTYGLVIASNAFTYLRGAITLIGTNGTDIAESDPASPANGTDFGAMQVGNALTNTFGIRNTGNAPLTLTSIDGVGTGGGSFTVTVFPTNVLLPGAIGQITVVCASQGGEQPGQLAFRDNVNVVPFTPEMGGYTVSVFNVRSYGNGSGLGLSQSTLTFNTTYGVDPASQTFDVSNVGTDPLVFSNTVEYATVGDNWLTITPAGSLPLAAAGSTTLTNSVNVSGINAGTHTATISVWSATATNSPQHVGATLVVAPTTQNITWTNPGTQTYSNETPLDASASSGLTPTYTLISGPAILHTDSYPFYASYTNTGTVTIEVNQDGNLNYLAALTFTQTYEVIGAPAGVTLTNLVQEYDGSPKTATCLTSPTGLFYNITYDGSSNAPTAVGTYEVISIIDEQFFYGGATGTLEITKASQTITFPTLGGWPTNGTVGLSATGGASGNPVTFGVLSGPGTITGLTNLAFTAIGDVYVTADQAGAGNYDPAPTVTNRVHVFSVTPDNGPYAGGNTITITNGHFGTITNAIIGIVRANDYSPLPSSVSITMPPATNAGLTDITLQTVEYGDILLHDAYTYNPRGRIAPAVYEEYRVEFRSSISTEYPSYTSPDGTYTWTQIARDGDWKELQTTNGAAGGVYLKPFGFSSGTGNGWDVSGYDWIAADPADSFIYLNSSAINTNYVVITNLQGSSYRVDVVNAYQSDGYINSDTLHPGIYQPGDPADNANYGNWPSGGNTNAGLNLDPYDTYTSQSNYVTWADATPSNGALSVVLFKTDSTANFLNCMRISGYSGMTPATPSSGSWTGGYPVVIGGENINDGSDITNVTLCGVQATIVSQALGQVWVVASASSSGSSGDIVVQSVSYGTTVGSNLFTYTGAGLTVLGTNGQEVANGEDASREKGTLFPPSQVGVIQTNTFSITNSGTEMLTIDPTDLSDQTDDTPFTVTELPATLSAGAVSNISVTFAPTNIGSFGVSLAITNNSPSAVFTLKLGGSAYQMSTNVGPWSGGNTIILTNGLIGSGSDITNITVGGYEATVGAQGSNWVQITLGSGSTNGGAGDIVIQSTSVGESTFANAYTYNPAGVIAGSSVTQAYVVGTGSLTNAAGSSGYGPIMFYYYSSHYQFLYTPTNFADAGLTGPAKIVALGFDVVSSTDGKALPSFLVRMKHTYMENMSGGMDGTDLTVCYSNAGYIATAGGFDMLPFDTPFEWDGSSNVIVDTAFAKASTWCNCGQTTYDAIDSRGSAYRTDAVDSSYDFDNGSTISVLPRIRVLTEAVNAAVEPSSGSWTGGYQVVISGQNLCNGSDITNLTICGVPVQSIDDQTATQIVVTAEATVAPGIGDVRIYSVSYGETVGSNAFTYTGAGIELDAPAFDPTLLGTMATNIFTVTNTGTEALLITSVTNIRSGGEYFDLSAMPTTVEPGTASNFPVVFNAAALGSYTPICHIGNNSPAATNMFDLYGSVYQISTNNGPYTGGNTIIITNGNLGTITNIIVRATRMSPLQSGPNWVSLILPAATNPGLTDITLQTTEYGDILFQDAYTYNPQGVISTNIPSSCFWTGNCPVVISGTDLCNGGMDDVISVTLAGATATVDSVNGSTQLVVTAGISPMAVGDVVINSTSHGTTIKSNAFTYLEPVMTALGTNGAAIASGDAATVVNGTDFGALVVGQGALTNTFSITNSGNTALSISGVSTSGTGAASFSLISWPATVTVGGIEDFTVIFEPMGGGTQPATLNFANDGTTSVYEVNLTGAGKGGGIALATNALHFETHYDGGNPAVQFIAMNNVGISAFTYTNAITYSPGATGWISITPANGTVELGGTTTLTNTVDITGVNAGSYTCNVQIISDDATNSPQTVRATLLVAPATQTISFAQIADMIITNTYGLSATGGASTNPVTFSVLSGPAAIAGSTNLSFNNVGEVQILANQAGDINYIAAPTVTNTFTVSPTKPVISTPTVSNILSKTAAIGATIEATNGAPVTQRGVLWHAEGDTNIYMAADLGTFGTGAFSMNVTGIIAGVTNYYQVFARNVSGTVYTAENSFLARPDAPELTGATNILADAFYANWNAAIGATNYYIDVSETNDFSSFIPGYNNLMLGDASSVNVTGLGSVVYYYYRVRAENDTGVSTNSDFWEVGLMMDLIINALPAEHDTPAPLGYGTNRVIVNTMVTNTVTTPAEESNGVRYACTGWSGTGDVPATGTANTVTFLFTVDSTLTWHWKTQYELTQTATGGTIDGLTNGWKDEGWIFDLIPIANDGYVFKRWRTNGVNAGSTKLLTIVADSPVAVEAIFTATSWDVDTQGTVTMTGYRLDTGSGLFYCTFRVCNPSGSSTVLRDRFLYAMDPDPVTYLDDPDGTSPTGKEYKDVTAEVKSKLQSIGNGDQVMDPGECVTLNEIPFWARNPETITSYFYSRGEPEIADRDTDGDGIPNSWEDQEGLNKNNPVDGGEDQDDDGVSSEQEYVADTNPFDANSFLHIYSITPDLVSGEEIGWIGGTSVVQDLEWAPALTGTWTRIQRFNPPTQTTNDWSNDPAQSPGFYRIKATR